ncbi:MAG TPA: acyl-CoA dehydrogenase family protein [Rubrivivax sp.]|nr:acyl-CoA dehydrogenase family protein [Rubrivivax sp.]
MDFRLPEAVSAKLAELDAFIDKEIKPLEREHPQYFDHRREYARTDWENDGRPHPKWRELISEMEHRADRAGHLRLGLPKSCGGGAADSLMIAAIREHLAAKGLGLHNDLQDESSIVGNFPIIPVLDAYGTPEQKTYIEGIISGKKHLSFGLTEPGHGSDATWLETTAVRDGAQWVINGMKRWNSQVARAHANLVFARSSGKPGDGKGITAFIVPTATPGHKVLYNHWTFNMPSDHAETELKDVRVPDSAILHKEGEGLMVAQRFVHENRIRQAAASAGAARYCITQAAKYARERIAFGEPLSKKQAVQFPLVELYAECEMVRNYIFRTAWEMGRRDPLEISDMVSICNFRANRLCCEAADRAMQIHGGMGYSRAMPFEHIYRHHRRYRITEGTEEVQMRRVAQYLFGFSGKAANSSAAA